MKPSTFLRRLMDAGILFRVVEPSSFSYNCHAHSLGITNRKVAGYAPDAGMIETILLLEGFVPCPDPPGDVPIIVVYRKDGVITHSAVKHPDSLFWSSKIGTGPVIEHMTLHCLAGEEYGTPAETFVRSTS